MNSILWFLDIIITLYISLYKYNNFQNVLFLFYFKILKIYDYAQITTFYFITNTM